MFHSVDSVDKTSILSFASSDRTYDKIKKCAHNAADIHVRLKEFQGHSQTYHKNTHTCVSICLPE